MGSNLETSATHAILPFMGRPLRIEYPSAAYHITSRGNARQDIYLDDDDRAKSLIIHIVMVKRLTAFAIITG